MRRNYESVYREDMALKMLDKMSKTLTLRYISEKFGINRSTLNSFSSGEGSCGEKLFKQLEAAFSEYNKNPEFYHKDCKLTSKRRKGEFSLSSDTEEKKIPISFQISKETKKLMSEYFKKNPNVLKREILNKILLEFFKKEIS